MFVNSLHVYKNIEAQLYLAILKLFISPKKGCFVF